MVIGRWLNELSKAGVQAAAAEREVWARASQVLRSGVERRIAAQSGLDDGRRVGGADRSPHDDAVIEAARNRPIVFRETYPPPAAPGLSFYGGVPIGPGGMVWPRRSRDGRPLTFLMQWEAAALAAQDATGLLPRDGVLYLFSSLLWGDEMLFHFVHHGGGTAGWAPLPVPDDLPPAWGDRAAHSSPFVSPHVPPEQQRPPRLLPRWPFVPMAIDDPEPESADEGDGSRFWRDRSEIKETLIRAQDPDARLRPDPAPKAKPGIERPFAAFPHDWAAVRVVAAAALDRLPRVAEWQWKAFAPEMDQDARAAMAAAWREEALALYREAIDHPLEQAIPQQRSDALWRRIAALELPLWPFHAAGESVNVSLGLGSEGVPAIPPALIEAGARRHSLGHAWLRDEYQHEFAKRTGMDRTVEAARARFRETRDEDDLKHIQSLEKAVSAAFAEVQAAGPPRQVRQVFAPVPNRMFGRPSYVQGYIEKHVDDWLLLLEITSSDGIGLGLGDGVLQFVIRPDDLAARRFDRVKAVCSGY